jgi:hypothetical protein
MCPMIIPSLVDRVSAYNPDLEGERATDLLLDFSEKQLGIFLVDLTAVLKGPERERIPKWKALDFIRCCAEIALETEGELIPNVPEVIGH